MQYFKSFHNPPQLLLCLLLAVFYLALPSNRLSAQCSVVFSNCPEAPLTLLDCDHNGMEPINWPGIIANPVGSCSGFTLVQTAGPLPGTPVPFGVYNIEYTAHATGPLESGASATCHFIVQVLPDLEPPVFTFCPPNITVFAGEGNLGQGMWPAPGVHDNCGGPIALTSNFPCGDMFPPGVTTVVYTAMDASGNISTCTFTVTVLPHVERQGNMLGNLSVTTMDALAKSNVHGVIGQAAGATAEQAELEVALLPNPFSEYLKLSATRVTEAPLKVGVYDLTGRLMLESVWQAGTPTFEVQTGNWAPGIYLIKIGNDAALQKQVYMGVKL